MSLATKYRPTTFNEVCGQNITTTILKRVIENRTFKNCYLFSGTSGTGKTTVARIFAKEINNGNGEPIELDCASNNGVDQVRAIIESANERSLVSDYKIFILDECHSFTTQAWQAFLKGIEETPKYTIFIFCTTEPQKLPQTILNRMQRFNFAPISAQEINKRLKYICKNEKFTNYEQTCDFISKLTHGGMRDAISYLEQVADYSTDLVLDNAKKVLGGLSYENMFKLTWALQNKSEKEILSVVDEMFASGQDLKQFVSVYLEFVLNLVKFIIFKNINLTTIPEYLADEANPVVQYTTQKENSLDYFNSLADTIFEIKAAIKNDTEFKTTIQILLIRFSRKN